MGHPYDIEHAQRLHIEWCQALLERTGLATTNQTEPQMRAVMLELRRSLAPDAVLAIANALPALERGIFLDGWSLDYAPDPPRDPRQFHERVHERVKAHHSPPESLTSDVFWLWNRELAGQRAETIRAHLPPALASLWPSEKAG